MYNFWTNIFTSLGEFFEWALEAVPAIHNFPNWLFSIIALVAFIYWMGELRKFAREDKA